MFLFCGQTSDNVAISKSKWDIGSQVIYPCNPIYYRHLKITFDFFLVKLFLTPKNMVLLLHCINTEIQYTLVTVQEHKYIHVRVIIMHSMIQ